MAIHNREDLHAFAPPGLPNSVAAPFGRGKRRSMKLSLHQSRLLAQRIRQLRENLAQHLLFTPLLKSAMHRFVVGIAPAACAIARRCSESTVPPPRPLVPAPVCGRGGFRGCVPRESIPRIRSHWSSRRRNMRAHYRAFSYGHNHFEIGSSSSTPYPGISFRSRSNLPTLWGSWTTLPRFLTLSRRLACGRGGSQECVLRGNAPESVPH